MKIIENIERLAEINCAGSIVNLDESLRAERRIIVNYLKVMEIIELDPGGGFHFVGKDATENTSKYKQTYNNF